MVIALSRKFRYFFIVQFADFLSSCKIDSSFTVRNFLQSGSQAHFLIACVAQDAMRQAGYEFTGRPLAKRLKNGTIL